MRCGLRCLSGPSGSGFYAQIGAAMLREEVQHLVPIGNREGLLHQAQRELPAADAWARGAAGRYGSGALRL